MQTKSLARIGAVAFVAVAITVTAFEMRDRPRVNPDQPPIAIATSSAELLRNKLEQCQAIGLAAASDDLCLRAWKENRRRFFALPADSSGFPVNADQPTDANAEVAAPPTSIATNQPAGEER